jgi:hypothetical protein
LLNPLALQPGWALAVGTENATNPMTLSIVTMTFINTYSLSWII